MNPFEMFKNVKNLQDKMEQMKQELEHKAFTGTAGAGMVTVVVNGQHQVVSVKIAPEIVDPNDIPTLEVLIASATNNANSQLQEYLQQEAIRKSSELGLNDLMKGGFPQ
ncbi:MAG: YbaB/EbfC family nucleoid-associated protein [Sphaerochaetaceae bacterium]|jgi:DNA-binding YbaB/EbfC family protein